MEIVNSILYGIVEDYGQLVKQIKAQHNLIVALVIQKTTYNHNYHFSYITNE